jgi:uncharacterized membrane protein
MTIALSIIAFLAGVFVGILLCSIQHFSRDNCDEKTS